MTETDLIKHLNEIYNFTGRPFYQNLKDDILKKDFYKVIAHDILFLVAVYFNNELFRNITWQEIQMIVSVLDFLEGYLVSELMTEKNPDILNMYIAASHIYHLSYKSKFIFSWNN